MHRRQFLKLQDFESIRPQQVESPTEEVKGLLLRFGRRAMATDFEILLPFGIPGATEAAEAGLDLIDQLEAQLTVYRGDSEVSVLNVRAAHAGPFRPEANPSSDRAAHDAVKVEENLFQLLTTCRRLHRETEGAFDVAIGALIKAWGFFKRQGRVPSEQERAEVRQRIGMEHVQLDEAGRNVAFLRPGIEINLGSIGKGYALDRVTRMLRGDWHIADALVHGGHSSIFAMGSEPGTNDGWTVGLLHPVQRRRRLGMMQLKNRGMGTSAATHQHLVHQGRKLGHILDPRIAWPAEGVLSATATAPTAAEADALATAFYIQGPDWTRAYCEQHPDIGGVVLPRQGKLAVLGSCRTEFAAASAKR